MHSVLARPLCSISSSVLMPSFGSVFISSSTIFRYFSRIASERSAPASRARAWSSVTTRRLAGNIRVWFSSRFRKRARSSHAIAVLTRVSASGLSAAIDTSASSSARISPGVITTSDSLERPAFRRRSRRISTMSFAERRERADSPNWISTSSSS